MKNKVAVVLLGLLAAGLIAQQTQVFRLPVLTNGVYQFVRVGPTLQVANGQLDALLPTLPAVPQFADQEVPTGTIDGTSATFTLVHPPNPPASLHLQRNGLGLKATFDYTLAGGTITFIPQGVPQPGDTLLAWYRY